MYFINFNIFVIFNLVHSIQKLIVTMQAWYYTNLNQLKRVYYVNNTFYVRQDTYKLKSTRKPCKIPQNLWESLSVQTVFVVKWPSHISVWPLRMPAYDDFLSSVVIRWCTSAARREVVERAIRARCHTHSYVGARCVRREILCMHKNSLPMPTYGPYAASTLCTRYANVPRVRGTVGVRWRNVHSTLTWMDTKCVNFTTSPLRVGTKM